jgi:hypothetical protein
MAEVQYVSDESGNPVSVIVPIDLWREIESERETAYLLTAHRPRASPIRYLFVDTYANVQYSPARHA